MAASEYVTSLSIDYIAMLHRWVENPCSDPLAGVGCNSYITVAYLGEGFMPCEDPLYRGQNVGDNRPPECLMRLSTYHELFSLSSTLFVSTMGLSFSARMGLPS